MGAPSRDRRAIVARIPPGYMEVEKQKLGTCAQRHSKLQPRTSGIASVPQTSASMSISLGSSLTATSGTAPFFGRPRFFGVPSPSSSVAAPLRLRAGAFFGVTSAAPSTTVLFLIASISARSAILTLLIFWTQALALRPTGAGAF
jgi:hypothetical protein